MSEQPSGPRHIVPVEDRERRGAVLAAVHDYTFQSQHRRLVWPIPMSMPTTHDLADKLYNRLAFLFAGGDPYVLDDEIESDDWLAYEPIDGYTQEAP